MANKQRYRRKPFVDKYLIWRFSQFPKHYNLNL
jgi:hypothetical protein